MLQPSSYTNKKLFSIGLVVLQLIMIPMFYFFLKVKVHTDASITPTFYPMLMDLNVMMIVGFGFINTYIRTYSYMGMIHNFFFNSISYQLFFFFNSFWKMVLLKDFSVENFEISFEEQDFTLASYAVAACNVGFGIVFGRVGFFQYFVMVILSMVTYTFNGIILNNFIKIYDVGGSIFGHSFGCYFGMGVSLILSRYKAPVTKIQHSNQTIIFSFLGCFFLWAYWPSINAIYLTQTPFQKSLVIMNTILSLCASVLSAFAFSIFTKGKLSVIDIFNGSLAGGIGSGSGTGLFYNPCACLILGFVSGIICVLGMQYLTAFIQKKTGLQDTFGIHNVQGLPGILGGLGGAIGIAISKTNPDAVMEKLLFFVHNQDRTTEQMVGYQILGTFSTVFFALMCGIVSGYIIISFYNIQSQQFYKDNLYFQLSQESLEMLDKKITYFEDIKQQRKTNNRIDNYSR